jgi:hypothetical protein
MISRNWATNGHMGAVEPFVFRKPCTNDLIVSQEKSFRHAHIHLTPYLLVGLCCFREEFPVIVLSANK